LHPAISTGVDVHRTFEKLSDYHQASSRRSRRASSVKQMVLEPCARSGLICSPSATLVSPPDTAPLPRHGTRTGLCLKYVGKHRAAMPPHRNAKRRAAPHRTAAPHRPYPAAPRSTTSALYHPTPRRTTLPHPNRRTASALRRAAPPPASAHHIRTAPPRHPAPRLRRAPRLPRPRPASVAGALSPGSCSELLSLLARGEPLLPSRTRAPLVLALAREHEWLAQFIFRSASLPLPPLFQDEPPTARCRTR
jgi:hypothetical protein